MLTLKQRISAFLVFLFSSLFIGIACYIPFKILSEEIDLTRALIILFFNLFISRKITFYYMNMKIWSNMKK